MAEQVLNLVIQGDAGFFSESNRGSITGHSDDAAYHCARPDNLYSEAYMSGPIPPPVMPLDGVRVLDLSRMIAGGVAGMLFADFGADVVKAEQPGSVDPLRQWTAEGQ